jgi:hypothetical protein
MDIGPVPPGSPTGNAENSLYYRINIPYMAD